MKAPEFNTSLYRPEGHGEPLRGRRGPLINSAGSLLIARWNSPITYNVIFLSFPRFKLCDVLRVSPVKRGTITYASGTIPKVTGIQWNADTGAQDPPNEDPVSRSNVTVRTERRASGSISYGYDVDYLAAKAQSMAAVRTAVAAMFAEVSTMSGKTMQTLTSGIEGQGSTSRGILKASEDIRASMRADFFQTAADASASASCERATSGCVFGYFGRRGSSVRFDVTLNIDASPGEDGKPRDARLTVYRGEGGLTRDWSAGPMPSWSEVFTTPVPVPKRGEETRIKTAFQLMLEGSTPYLAELETVSPTSAPPMNEHENGAEMSEQFSVSVDMTFSVSKQASSI